MWYGSNLQLHMTVFPLCFLQGECDPAFGSEFVFTVHSKELIVGDVFVRIYNEQPTFVLEVWFNLEPRVQFIIFSFHVLILM